MVMGEGSTVQRPPEPAAVRRRFGAEWTEHRDTSSSCDEGASTDM